MNRETENQIKEEMKRYKPGNMEEYDRNFVLYKAEVGWEEWMNEYITTGDNEDFKEEEIKEIEKIQRELWEGVFGIREEYLRRE